MLSAKAARQLERLGVEVRVGARVSRRRRRRGDDEVRASRRKCATERISARTVLWAAGVQATALAQSLPGPHDRMGRMLVTPTSAAAGHRFDIRDRRSGVGVRRTASRCRALRTPPSKWVRTSRNAIARRLARTSPHRRAPFRYRDRGSLATIGRKPPSPYSPGYSTFGSHRVVDVAAGAYLFPDRFSQSHHHDGGLDAGVHHASAACASDLCAIRRRVTRPRSLVRVHLHSSGYPFLFERNSCLRRAARSVSKSL